MVDRFDAYSDDSYEMPEGEFVLYDDYAVLETRVKVLTEGLKAGIRAANLALFVIQKQRIMPNDSWRSGFDKDMDAMFAAIAPQDSEQLVQGREGGRASASPLVTTQQEEDRKRDQLDRIQRNFDQLNIDTQRLKRDDRRFIFVCFGIVFAIALAITIAVS